MKICIFPNDPISEYYKKGEIKERYYNPKNFFEEVHIISPSESDVDESKVKSLVASLKNVDIEKELESASLVAAAPASGGEASKEEKKEEKPKEEKKEAAAEGLSALFG